MIVMARSPRRIQGQRRSRSRSRELTRLRTQLNGKGNAYSSKKPTNSYEEVSPDREIILSDTSTSPQYPVRSSVHVADVHLEAPTMAEAYGSTRPTSPQVVAGPSTANEPVAITSQLNTIDTQVPGLPADILDILGDSKGEQEVFGPNIREEISKRWGLILCEGLNKEQKKEVTGKVLIPENFKLVKAPKLNPEIAAVLNDSTRNRDKRLEKAQNILGLGISALTNLTSSLIDRDIDKMEIIKQLSQTNQILLDLHFENTINRRKLIMYSMDKKFLDIIKEVKRDSFLFGENLTEKIKASKSAEKSGLQFKKGTSPGVNMPTRKPVNQQGNWRAPPRQVQRGSRQGGARGRPAHQYTKRPPPVQDRYQDAPRTRPKPQLKSQ